MTAYRGDQSMGVLIGIDPHKSVNAAAAIDDQGELAGHETFPANRKGLRALERWAKRFPERRWAVEGAAGIGRPVAQRLAMAGEKVVDVPPKLSSKARLLSTGNARKNDRLDATFTAQAALKNERLAPVLSEDGDDAHVEVLRLLTERRLWIWWPSAPVSSSSSPPMLPPGCCGESDHGTNQRVPESDWPPR
jgi:transposase